MLAGLAIAAGLNKISSAFTFSITGYGVPTVNGWNVSLPVAVRFVNPLPVGIDIDQVTATLYLTKNDQWVQVGNVQQPISIGGGTSDINITAQLNLQDYLGGSILDSLKTLYSSLQSKSIAVRTDVSATYAGLTLPTQSITQNVSLPI